jgi:glycosyltransferase involved in cell wall biosynthesis
LAFGTFSASIRQNSDSSSKAGGYGPRGRVARGNYGYTDGGARGYPCGAVRPYVRGRILAVLQPPVGGVPTYVAMLARGLAARGWDVVVAGPARAPDLQGLAGFGVETVDLDVDRAPGLRRDGAAVAQLIRLARRRRIDLVHGHSSKASLLSALAARGSGVPSVYTPHAWAFQMRRPVPLRAALGGAEMAINRLHARIITVCRAEATAAARWRIARAEQIRLVHTGLPACAPAQPRTRARAALGVGSENVVVAWVGRRGAAKRPEELADVASWLPDAAIVLALGYGLTDDPSLTRVLSEAGVRVVGPDIEPDLLLAAADVFVLTSAWEAFPMAVLEAMRAGLPVVAHAVGGVVEQVEDGVSGHLVERDDVRGLAECTRTLVTDATARRRMGAAAGERFRQRFTLERMLDGVERVYEEILPRDGRRPRPTHLSGS